MAAGTPHNRQRQLDYDVVVVGSGPAGIFAAIELTAQQNGVRVALLDKGPDLPARLCPQKRQPGGCIRCQPCSIVTGWGGAGAFSDGKLTLTTEYGGSLDQYLGRGELARHIEYVDRIYLHFGATEKVYGADPLTLRDLTRRAAAADLALIPAVIRHLGTERCYDILMGMRRHLEGRVDVITGATVQQLLVEDGRVAGALLEDGRVMRAKYVVAAPGREGASWFAAEATRIGLALESNAVDIGVRVEVPAVVTQHLTDAIYESKLVYYTKSFDDRVRVFCMAPHGEVVMENNDGLVTVNGHSYAGYKTDLTNFALLVSKTFTEPFKEPLSYGRNIAALANMLGGGVLVQRLGDLLAGRRSTDKRIARGMVQPSLREATPGDLSLVLPYRHLVDILEMMQALDKVAPGIYSRHTLLYGIEVKFYSARAQLSGSLETQIGNLFAIGDGAGVTRGLIQASVSGVWVAREIRRRQGLAERGMELDL
jgi:uncharacterized FAD-dependent dehydrogenase